MLCLPSKHGDEKSSYSRWALNSPNPLKWSSPHSHTFPNTSQKPVSVGGYMFTGWKHKDKFEQVLGNKIDKWINHLFKCIGETFQIKLEFRSVGFWGEGKTGVPGEKPLGVRTRTNNKLNPHVTPSPGIEPGSHWWGASALTTAPSLLPQNELKIGK